MPNFQEVANNKNKVLTYKLKPGHEYLLTFSFGPLTGKLTQTEISQKIQNFINEILNRIDFCFNQTGIEPGLMVKSITHNLDNIIIHFEKT